jgi:hypothetical protein
MTTATAYANGNGRPQIISHPAMADRPPPVNLEAERSVLGCIMLDNDVLPEIVTWLAPSDFYRDTHQVIYRAIVDLYDRGIGVDACTLADELHRGDRFAGIGGDDAMAEIVDSVPTAANARYYADIVREKSIGRHAIDIATAILRDAYSGELTAPEILDRAARLLAGIEVFGRKYSDEELGMTRASACEILPIHWLMPGRILRYEYNLIAGRGKQGKSSVAMKIAATASTGGPWWDGSGTAPRGHVFILSAEDDSNRVIAPRLKALGADLDQITLLEAKRTVRRPDGGKAVSFTDLTDLAHWREVFSRVRGPVLMIIDPLPSYMGRGVNDRKNSDVRAILDPFIALCKESGITLIGITHFGKSADGRSAADKVLDSIAYVNLARGTHYVCKDPDHPGRSLFMPGDCNYGKPDLPALAFVVVDTTIPDGQGGEVTIGIPEFQPDPVAVDVDDIVNHQAGRKGPRGPRPLKTDQFAEWLRQALKDGAVAIFQLIDRARAEKLLAEPTAHNPKPSLTSLYHARDRLPTLYPGWEIEETETCLERGGNMRAYKAWQLREQSITNEERVPF